MSYWIEIHCDTTLEERDRLGRDELGRSSCLSNKGGQPGSMARTIAAAKRDVEQQARRQGWLHKDGKWFCPACRILAQKELPK